jgi:hypothetical protein
MQELHPPLPAAIVGTLEMPVLNELRQMMAANQNQNAEIIALLAKTVALQGEELLTVEGVCQLWPGISADTVRTYCRQGKLKAVQITPGGTYYIRRRDIAEFVNPEAFAQ